ncbi:radical SAM protein [Desulfosarcina cetonica]|uniref:radical SAM protein n=1 Tax=Desulfosarcina cetonica TaxID=90730 RepID=UPI0006CFAA8F|nr:radical SAM protein [Desulfosarcina cetonica]
MKCTLCERHCHIAAGQAGACGMITSDGSSIQERYPDRYLAAVETAIESMPMVHYHPRGQFLQVCTVGCNFTCRGCVSGILTDHLTAIQGTFQTMTPEAVVDKAIALGCLGVMFCFNEPTVSYFTFRRLAEMAKRQGLRVGCSTNGYMTEAALDGLIPLLDFVNMGLKGACDETYHACGVASIAPVLRNLARLVDCGVYVEISAIFRRHGETELLQAAEQVAALSADIPFQVMRFIPFGDAPEEMEPSVRQAEAVCSRVRQHLRHVYLFNTPGTDALNSRCPACGETIMRRGFFGPMCANLFDYRPDARCDCGYQLPIVGEIHDTPANESGYFGGYRTINALSMIRSILEVIGVTDKTRTDAVISHVLATDLIKTLHNRLNRIEAYFDTVDEFAAMTGREARAKAFRHYVGDRVAAIQAKVGDLPKPPVYCTLGHPRIAMFVDKMESCLIEAPAGS